MLTLKLKEPQLCLAKMFVFLADAFEQVTVYLYETAL